MAFHAHERRREYSGEGLLSHALLPGLALLIGFAGRLSHSPPSVNVSWLEVYFTFGIWLAFGPDQGRGRTKGNLYVITDQRALHAIAPHEQKRRSLRGERLINTVCQVRPGSAQSSPRVDDSRHAQMKLRGK